MKLLDILRKLGIVRFGTKMGTYKSGKDRPYEFMSGDVYNAEKETVTRGDIKKVFGAGKKGNKPVVCGKCSTPLKPGAKFCGNCGAPAAEAVTASADEKPAATGSPEMPGKSKSHGCLGWVFVGLGIVGLLTAICLTMNNDKESASEPGPESASKPAASIGKLKKIAGPAGHPAESPMQPIVPTKKKQPADAKISYAVFKNAKFGFSLEVPRHWTQKTRDNAMVFSGAKGTEQYLSTINIQLVNRAPGSSLAAQAEELISQWQKLDGYKLEGYNAGEFHNKPCVYLAATYLALDTDNKYQQVQVIAERDKYHYFMAYTAPARVADKYLPVFYHAVKTFRFLEVKEGEKQAGNDSETLGESLDRALDEISGAFDKLLEDLGGSDK